jgi:hypothetical protein
VNFLLNFLTLILFSTWTCSGTNTADSIFYGKAIEDYVQADSDLPQHYKEQVRNLSGLSITAEHNLVPFGSLKTFYNYRFSFSRNNFSSFKFSPNIKKELSAQIFPFHLFW